MKRSLMVAVLLTGLVATACRSGNSATPAPHKPVIGVLNLADIFDPSVQGLIAGLKEHNIDADFLYHGAVGDIAKLPDEAALLLKQSDILVAISTPGLKAAVALKPPKPIVFLAVYDPVGAGVVSDLSHPGGTVTGIQHGVWEGKRAEWLTRIIPGIQRLYAPYNPQDQSATLGLVQLKLAAEKLHLTLLTRECPTQDEITKCINEIPPEAQAFYLMPDNLIASRLPEIVTVTLRHHLPLAAINPTQTEAGALFSCDLLRSVNEAASQPTHGPACAYVGG